MLPGEIELILPVYPHSRKIHHTRGLHLMIGPHGDEYPCVGAPFDHKYRAPLGGNMKPLKPPNPPARTVRALAFVVKGKPSVIVIIERKGLPGGDSGIFQGRTTKKSCSVVVTMVIAGDVHPIGIAARREKLAPGVSPVEMEGKPGLTLIAFEFDLLSDALDAHPKADGLRDEGLSWIQLCFGSDCRPGPCRKAVVLQGHPPPHFKAPVTHKILPRIEVSRLEAHLCGTMESVLLTPINLLGSLITYPLHDARILRGKDGKVVIIGGEMVCAILHGTPIGGNNPHALGTPSGTFSCVDANGNGRTRGKPEEVFDPHRSGLVQDEIIRLEVESCGELAQGRKRVGKLPPLFEHGGPYIHCLGDRPRWKHDLNAPRGIRRRAAPRVNAGNLRIQRHKIDGIHGHIPSHNPAGPPLGIGVAGLLDGENVFPVFRDGKVEPPLPV